MGCQETSQQVHHSSAVVGHDSQVVAHGNTGYAYGKREAEPGYSTGPKCVDKKDRQCHKRPVQNERKVPRPVCKTIVDTTYIEECEETFTTQCHTASTQLCCCWSQLSGCCSHSCWLCWTSWIRKA